MRVLDRWILAAAAAAALALAGCGGGEATGTSGSTGDTPAGTTTGSTPAATQTASVTCPVMKQPIADPAKAQKVLVNNTEIPICCAACDESLAKDPAQYLTEPVADPVSGEKFPVTKETPKIVRDDGLFLFASAETKAQFEKDPAAYIKPPAGAG